MKILIWVGDHLAGEAAVAALIATFVKSWLNGRRLRDVHREVKAVKSEVNTIHIDINSRLTELLALNSASAHSLGVEAGRKIERDETDFRAPERERERERGRERERERERESKSE